MSAAVDPVASYPGPSDPRPVVRTGTQRDLGLYAFLAVLLVGGAWLFLALTDAREDAATGSAIAPRGGTGERIASPPPLAGVPGVVAPFEAVQPFPLRAPLAPVAVRVLPAPPGPAVPAYDPAPPTYTPPPQPAVGDFPSAVYEADYAIPSGVAAPDNATATADAVRATRLADPAMTVTQGTIIPAVLETAFDSTRPGRVRALVQRDVRGFDGSEVLIPRGSRLFGEYQAGISPGERRAMITWTRLMRPDGVSIALDSPASDPLGRGGVEGEVNSHFFARLGNALLQTVLDVGSGIAVGRANRGGGTVLALPGSTQNITGDVARPPQPVLQIAHGTSVSVYVARDLDFSGT